MKTILKAIPIVTICLCLGIVSCKKETTCPPKNELDNGLIAHYPFNGNANDESGFERHGTVNNAILTTDRKGQNNSAYNFNGTNAYINIPKTEGMANGNFTFSVWVKLTKLPTNSNSFCPISIGNENQADHGIFLGNNYVSSLTGFSVSSYNNVSFASNIGATIGTLPEENQWYHLVATRSDTKVNLYLNGVLAKSSSTNSLLPKYTFPIHFYIGNRIPGSFSGYTYHFNGLIDDVRVYNRSLTETEIEKLYKL